MDNYITGATIKRLREAKKITQTQLAKQIGVSSKAVSKWETAKGLPDITLIEPLAKALGVSVMELMSGETVINKNVSSNILRSKFYVCPVCGNVIRTTGDTVISCCGITLPPLEAEEKIFLVFYRRHYVCGDAEAVRGESVCEKLVADRSRVFERRSHLFYCQKECSRFRLTAIGISGEFQILIEELHALLVVV